MKTNYKHTIVFVLFFIFMTHTVGHHLYAQNCGPMNPEPMSFEPIDGTDLVNPLTGDFAYSIPLLEIPGPEVSYPIVLSYHGGVSVDQEASWVGLGWNINPGAITRSVNGISDDVYRGLLYNGYYDSDAGSYSTSTIGLGAGWMTAEIGVTYSWGSNYTGLGFYGGIGPFNYSHVNGVEGYGINLAGYMYNSQDGKWNYNALGTLGTVLDVLSSIQSVNNIVNISNGVKPTYNGLGITISALATASTVMGAFQNTGSPQAIGPKNITTNITSSIDLSLPIWIFNFSFSQFACNWTIYQPAESFRTGTLYMEDGRTPTNEPSRQAQLVGMDVENISEFKDFKVGETSTLMLPCYDSYSVNSQGLTGNITPRLFECKNIVDVGGVLSVFDENVGNEKEEYWYHFKSVFDPALNRNVCPEGFDTDTDPDNVTSYKAFDFLNSPSSFLKVSSGRMINANLLCGPIWDYDPQDIQLLSSINAGGPDRTTYNSTTRRKIAGRYIEWISNKDIKNNTNLDARSFLETLSLCGQDLIHNNNTHIRGDKFPDNGIGSITITKENGVVYHYSLPVYQFEQFIYEKNMTLSTSGRIVSMFSATRDPWAYTWLLTAITGPDFIDIDQDRIPDEGDLGYWVRFDYGNWTDAYVWKTPFNDSKMEEQWVSENDRRNGYSYGRKQIYYLNEIHTPTHTAYFVKDVRTDGKGYISSGYSENGLPVGQKYQLAVPGTVAGNPAFNIGGFNYTPNFTINYGFPYVANLFSYFTSYAFPSNYDSKVLKLSEIILTKNNEISLNPAASSYFVTNGPVDIQLPTLRQDAELFLYLPGGYPSQGTAQGEYKLNSGTAKAYFKDNILDINDIAGLSISDHAIKRIKLAYDDDNLSTYNLCYNAPNAPGGKLTLNKVRFFGQNDFEITPPYRFLYNNETEPTLNNYPTATYDRDDWGYDLRDPSNWSLKSIVSPLGSVINVEYEPDSYKQSSFIDVYDFSNQRFLFEKTSDGGINSKTCKFLNNTFFKVGDQITLELTIEGAEPPPNHPPCDQLNFTQTTTLVITQISEGKLFLNPSLNTYEHHTGSCDYQEITEVRLVGSNAPFQGGGIRVKQISINDGYTGSSACRTTYNYNDPATQTISGIALYPAKGNTVIKSPYSTYLYTPLVMYEYCTVTNLNKLGVVQSASITQFDIPKYETQPPTGFKIGMFFEVEDIYHNTECNTSNGNHPYHVDNRCSKIHDYRSAIGRILQSRLVNKNGQVEQKISYTYKNPRATNVIGTTEESFSSRKRLIRWDNTSHQTSNSTWYLNVTSNVQYASILESEQIEHGNSFETVDYVERDVFTGDPLRTSTTDGLNYYLEHNIPAYYIYLPMGLKATDLSNTNMLTQPAASYVWKSDQNNAKIGLISADIQTWGKNWIYRDFNGSRYYDNYSSTGDIYRKESNYKWKGSLNLDGTLNITSPSYPSYVVIDEPSEYGAYVNGVSIYWSSLYNGDGGTPINPWMKTNQITRYNPYSEALESCDINKNYSAIKQSADGFLTIGNVTNANYCSFACTGFEDEKPLINGYNTVGGEIFYIPSSGIMRQESDANRTAHTGKYLMKVVQAQYGPIYKSVSNGATLVGLQTGRTYRASVWVHADSPPEASIVASIDGSNLGPITWKSVAHNDPNGLTIGDWTLIYLDFDVPLYYLSTGGNTTNDFRIYLSNMSGTTPAYFDDFRIQPLDATLQFFVYDKQNNLIAILDNNNLATIYEYDNGGRLIAQYRETIAYGIKKQSSFQYHFKEQ